MSSYSLSVVTPIRGRENFIPQLIECFHSQNVEAELIVVDNSRNPQKFPDFVKSFYVGHRQFPTGVLRNFCAEHATGEIIAHFDSDDYYDPGYLRESLDFLRSSGKSVIGCHSILFWDCRKHSAHRFIYQRSRAYACGTSLVYYKKWWQAHKFSEQSIGEDTKYCDEARDCDQLASRSTDLIVARRNHSYGNTCKHELGSPDFIPLDATMLPSGFNKEIR
jgi:glycosyltransferase involved in cell wall biosynthesis